MSRLVIEVLDQLESLLLQQSNILLDILVKRDVVCNAVHTAVNLSSFRSCIRVTQTEYISLTSQHTWCSKPCWLDCHVFKALSDNGTSCMRLI